MNGTTEPDLGGRTCLVTGANRGIGLATSIALGPTPRVNALCPDVNATELLMRFRQVPAEQWADKLAAEAPPSTAARVIMALVGSPGTGRYLEEGVDVTPSPLACDPRLADWLWHRCAELTGLPADDGDEPRREE